MNWKRTASTILFAFFFFISAQYAPAADTQDWRKDTAAAREARARGEYTLAQTFYKQAIDLQEKTLGPNSPAVAVSLNNLAVSYQDASMDTQADLAYRRAVAILEEHPGQENLLG